MALIHSDHYSDDLAKLSATIQPGKTLLRTKHGYFLVLNHDILISTSLMKYGELSEYEWDLMKPFIKPEMVVVDAGTHLGTFLVPFAHRVGPKGKVIGFEPQPVIHECLMTAIMLNKVGHNTQIHHCCIGNSNEELVIDEPDYDHVGQFAGLTFNEKGYNEAKMSNKKIKTHVVRLDDVFKEPRFDFLKIDVEGMENDVLLGGTTVIKKFRPVMFIENCRRAKSPELMQTIFNLGYRAWWHTGRLFKIDNFNKSDENLFGNRCNTNVLCIPKERGDGEVPKGLIECTDIHHNVIAENGQITPSIPDYEPRI